MGSSGENVQKKLRPDMVSFRALVRAFIRDYIAQHDQSPSYGEMAAHFECSRARVKQAVLSLARSGLIVRVPGPRGLRMPTEAEEALRKLKEQGWVVNSDEGSINAPIPSPNPSLLPPPELDYPCSPALDRKRGGDTHPSGSEAVGEQKRDDSPENR